MNKLLDWQCKCGTVYGLERNVPVILHEKVPDRKNVRNQLA